MQPLYLLYLVLCDVRDHGKVDRNSWGAATEANTIREHQQNQGAATKVSEAAYITEVITWEQNHLIIY